MGLEFGVWDSSGGRLQWGDRSHAEALQSLRLYATEILPALAEGRVAMGRAVG